MSIVENETTTIARHDPAAGPNRWTLASVDGRLPTQAELEEFREDHSEDAQETADEGSEDDIRELIRPGSARLIEETADYGVYRFEPSAEDEEDAEFNRHLDATLRVARNDSQPYVESIEMRAREPFSPAMGVKIQEFSTVMTYGPVGDAGVVLPAAVVIRLVGAERCW